MWQRASGTGGCGGGRVDGMGRAVCVAMVGAGATRECGGKTETDRIVYFNLVIRVREMEIREYVLRRETYNPTPRLPYTAQQVSADPRRDTRRGSSTRLRGPRDSRRQGHWALLQYKAIEIYIQRDNHRRGCTNRQLLSATSAPVAVSRASPERKSLRPSTRSTEQESTIVLPM